MELIVFSDARNADEYFYVSKSSLLFTQPEFYPTRDLSKTLKKLDSGALVYLDCSGLSQEAVSRYIRALSKDGQIAFGLIDPANAVEDSASLFHDGAVDYVNKTVLKNKITQKRLNQVLKLIEVARPDALKSISIKPKKAKAGQYISSGRDWRIIVPGMEYTFCFLFFELDGVEEMEKNYGRKNLNTALSSFKDYIEDSVRPYNGRLWIWSGFGGLVIFPFDLERNDVLECGFRLILFKPLYDIEESIFPFFLSFRLALHIGNMVYADTKTGNVVSDSLNSVYHLGQQFTKPGNFFVTEEALSVSDELFLEYYVPAGDFEGRKIFRMRLPLHME